MSMGFFRSAPPLTDVELNLVLDTCRRLGRKFWSPRGAASAAALTTDHYTYTSILTTPTLCLHCTHSLLSLWGGTSTVGGILQGG